MTERFDLKAVAVLALAALALVAAPAFAGEASSSAAAMQSPATVADPASQAAPEFLQVNVAGMMVQVDPTTGRLRPPTPEEARRLSAAMARMLAPDLTARRLMSSTGARSQMPTVIPNGGERIELPEYLHEFSVVRLQPDGTLTQACVQGLEQAAQAVEAPANPVQEEE